jgi:hypothetical protein
MKSLTKLAFAFVFTVSIGWVYGQQVPRLFIQGALKDANGAAVPDGTYSVQFGLYDAVLDGTANWTETATVNTKGGLYSHYLGSVTPLVTEIFDQTQFLGVKVGAFEMEPRTELTYAPYTFKTFTAIFADKVVCSGAVGDIKYSVLNPTQFALENGSCWVPMNGGAVSGTMLGNTLGISTLPNPSGMFFRAQEYNNGNDPDRLPSTPIASVQTHTYKAHNHTGTAEPAGAHSHTLSPTHSSSQGTKGPGDATGTELKQDGTTTATISGGAHTHSLTINNTGGGETRPKNMNLYVYIRVN